MFVTAFFSVYSGITIVLMLLLVSLAVLLLDGSTSSIDGSKFLRLLLSDLRPGRIVSRDKPPTASLFYGVAACDDLAFLGMAKLFPETPPVLKAGCISFFCLEVPLPEAAWL